MQNGRDDNSNAIITLGLCFSMSVYIRNRFCFMLIGGNLTAQSLGSLFSQARNMVIWIIILPQSKNDG